MRALLLEGWEWGDLFQGVLAILIVAAVSQTLAFLALRGRVQRG
jgi:ABC-2 type transport system permease protein